MSIPQFPFISALPWPGFASLSCPSERTKLEAEPETMDCDVINPHTSHVHEFHSSKNKPINYDCCIPCYSDTHKLPPLIPSHPPNPIRLKALPRPFGKTQRGNESHLRSAPPTQAPPRKQRYTTISGGIILQYKTHHTISKSTST